MKKIVVSVAALSAALALSGCGRVVGSFIPPQTVSNPAGLEGKQLVASSPLTIEAVVGTVSYSTAGAPFDDITIPELPLNIKPRGLEFKTGFAKVDVNGLCAKPQQVNLTVRRVKLEASDATNKASFDSGADRDLAAFTLTKKSEGVGTAAYDVSAGTLSVAAPDAGTVVNFFTVLTSGGKNTASVEAKIRATQNELAGCTMAFTLKDVSVVLSQFQ
ncbi:hypothetical protein [Deinococcus aquaedulcis]|uniref:hypothetical protein n=1 Tax=Deinococcus aquaedulcis TaxID=2840455 RepID=UPI001C83E6B8|nr:hypothetical protein [Deinococcus aquaedulcis]